MSLRIIVIGNMDQYVPYHISRILSEPYQESKHGSFELTPDTSQGVHGHIISSWSVAGVTQPSYEDLMIYTEDEVFTKRRMEDSILNQLGRSLFQGDMMELRQRLLTFVNPEAWSSLSLREKTLLAQAFLVGPAQRQEVFTTFYPHLSDQALALAVREEEEKRSQEYHLHMVHARASRLRKAEALIYNALNTSDAKSVMYDIRTLKSTYVDGLDLLFEYLDGTGTYVGAGLVNTGFEPLAGYGTLSELKERIKEHLQ